VTPGARREKPGFEAVLIANRGEIAVLIARTLRRLGIRSLLACHPIDAAWPAARAVDAVVPLASDDPLVAYLDGDAIADAAERAGADAIHPGYGFLAERAHFAQAVVDAGLVFIGPPASAIEAMGDKTAARRRMIAAGVPVVPGTAEPAKDAAHETSLDIAGR